MVNAYKSWPDEKLIANGKRLAELIPMAYNQMMAIPKDTMEGKLKISRHISVIHDAEITLKALRNEWMVRHGLEVI